MLACTGAAPPDVEENADDSGSRPANKVSKGKWLKGVVKVRSVSEVFLLQYCLVILTAHSFHITGLCLRVL